MALYALDDLTLEVTHADGEGAEDLAQLLHDVSFVGTEARVETPTLRLSVSPGTSDATLPRTGRQVFRPADFGGVDDGFYGVESRDCFCLTDGASAFCVQAAHRRGDARLAGSFVQKPRLLQRAFWTFGLLKLLRPLGIYGLHAAGLADAADTGVLIVGRSGSGKSTLAIDLLRQGWTYLSDDTVLLRMENDHVKALAFRRDFYVELGDGSASQLNLQLGETIPDALGQLKQRVDMERTFPGQHIRECVPRVLVFPRIVPSANSVLALLRHPEALKSLLEQSGPLLFDRDTMSRHLAVLTRLSRQAACYELRAGRDLHRGSEKLVHLLPEPLTDHGADRH